LTQFRLVLCKN